VGRGIFFGGVKGLQGSKRYDAFIFATFWCCGEFYLCCVAALGRSDVVDCFVSVPMVELAIL
jgi:hypothetical protein